MKYNNPEVVQSMLQESNNSSYTQPNYNQNSYTNHNTPQYQQNVYVADSFNLEDVNHNNTTQTQWNRVEIDQTLYPNYEYTPRTDYPNIQNKVHGALKSNHQLRFTLTGIQVSLFILINCRLYPRIINSNFKMCLL